jgi:hypothetical protein
MGASMRMSPQARPGVRLLAGAASNALGTINDAGRLVARARGRGLVLADGVHYAAHTCRCRRGAATSCLLGLQRIPARRGIVGRRPAGPADAPKLAPASTAAPDLETGTLNHEGIVGAGAVVEFSFVGRRSGAAPRAPGVVMHALHERGSKLIDSLWN